MATISGTVNAGILYGHGPPQPYNLLNTRHEDTVDALIANDDIRRLALFQDGTLRPLFLWNYAIACSWLFSPAALKLYAPKLYDYYHGHTLPLRERMPLLHPNWDRRVFSAAAFNFGPRAIMFPRRDCMSLAFGLCAIHALGNYDYTKDGHLVLGEAKRIIQFPPGALILVLCRYHPWQHSSRKERPAPHSLNTQLAPCSAALTADSRPRRHSALRARWDSSRWPTRKLIVGSWGWGCGPPSTRPWREQMLGQRKGETSA